MRSTTRTLASSVALVLGSAIVPSFTAGCGARQTPPPETTAASVYPEAPPPPTEAAPEEPENEMQRPWADGQEPGMEQSQVRPQVRQDANARLRGFPGLFVESFGELDLRPRQRAALQAIENDLRNATAPTRDAMDRLLDDLAVGVASGQLDRGLADADIELITESAAGSIPQVQAALDQAHELLDQEQRRDLVDAMRIKAEVRRDVRQFEGRASRPIDGLAATLGLSAEQEETLGIAEHSVMRMYLPTIRQEELNMNRSLTALARSFPGDTFDAASLNIGTDAGNVARMWATHVVDSLAAMLPLLTPGQRTILAARLRTRGERSLMEGLE